MSIQNLDSLKSLAALMDLITNPAKYQAIIDGANKVVDDYRKAAGHLVTVRDVQEYKSKVEADVARREVAIDKAKEAIEKLKEELETVRQNYDERHDRIEVAVKAREVAVQKREDAVKDVEVLQATLRAELQALVSQKRDADQRQDALKKLEATLKAALK